MGLIVLLLFAAVAAGEPPVLEKHNHSEARSFLGSPEEEIESLAANVDTAIKLCSELIARAGVQVKEVGSAERLTVARGQLNWLEDPPKALKQTAEASHGPARIGLWLGPHAVIWIIAHKNTPACRILVGGSPWTKAVRPVLYEKIQVGSFWKIEGVEMDVMPGLRRATFIAELPKGNVTPTISVTASSKENNPGPQLNIGVYLLAKDKK